MDFEAAPEVIELAARLRRFMDDLILPSIADWHRYADAGEIGRAHV